MIRGAPHDPSLRSDKLQTTVSVRRVLLLAAFAAIVLTSLDPFLMKLPFVDRTPLARGFAGYADRQWGEFPRFLAGVAAHTRAGDAIAIVVPGMRWDYGYAYAFYRATYLLPGRQVVPLVDDRDRAYPERLRVAQYVAAWRTQLPPSHPPIVWSGQGGVLMRR
jgi:hypothetical protein